MRKEEKSKDRLLRQLTAMQDRLEELEALEKERNQTKEALRESEEKYRTILHNIEDGYYEVDLAGNLTFFNKSLCHILGYSEDEMLGMNNRRYMSEETAKKVYDTFNEVYQSGKTAKAFDWELIRKDGERRFLETSISLIQDSNGFPIGFRGIGRDITERKEAEERFRVHQQQLMQASKMVALGTLVSGVAHEVNNPNNFIMINTPILRDAWEGAMPILEEYYAANGDFILGGMKYSEMRIHISKLFSGILEGSKRIKQIVEDLKNYARQDTADMSQLVDINAVLSSALSLLSNLIGKRTKRFSLAYGKDLPKIRGNLQRLEQVMINLIQNACEALPDAQKGILVSTAYNEETGLIAVIVEDEGIGIRKEILTHITDPFFTTKQDTGGLGLGLSISSRIVEEHGGRLRFTSEPGKGTRAEIVLPAQGITTERKDLPDD